jgi:hypothetical protein
MDLDLCFGCLYAPFKIKSTQTFWLAFPHLCLSFPVSSTCLRNQSFNIMGNIHSLEHTKTRTRTPFWHAEEIRPSEGANASGNTGGTMASSPSTRGYGHLHTQPPLPMYSPHPYYNLNHQLQYHRPSHPPLGLPPWPQYPPGVHPPMYYPMQF